MSTVTRTMKRQCILCGKEFITRRLRQKFCSEGCRYKHFQETHLLITLDQYTEYQKLKENCPHVDFQS